MNKVSADLYPMMVNPLAFQRGDVVKKIISDNVTSPYVGIITSVVPSTNKVEVQWPQSIGIEDPWELIKVNPLFNPPVVNQDHFYQSYENSEKVQNHINSLRHYNVLHDFLSEVLQPVIMRASELYNEGLSKNAAFETISEEFDNRAMVFNALNRIFNDKINIKKSSEVYLDGEYKNAELYFSGDSDIGFKLSYSLGDSKKEYFFDNYKSATDTFNKVNNIFETLNSSSDGYSIVAEVNRKNKE